MTRKPVPTETDDFTLDVSIGAQMKRTQRAMLRSMQLRLAAHGVPIGMWFFLRALWEEDGLSQGEISERVGTTAATATEQLRNMEASGMVVRQPSEADRRKVHFFLTAKGHALRPELIEVPQEVERTALAGLTPGEAGFLRLALKRIQANLAAADAAAEGADAPPDDD